MTRRAEQLTAEIHRAVQAALDRGLQDPRVSGMITVTSVRLTPDMKLAFVNVSILPEDRQQLTMYGLKSAARHLRHEIADKLAVRQMPELVFKLDASLKKQAAVMGDIARATEDRLRREAQSGQGPGTDTDPGPDQDGSGPGARDAYAQVDSPDEDPT
jgi:ribosome-binding factor A